jgi:3'(2'), 5'-bisphosphate nucleotidase
VIEKIIEIAVKAGEEIIRIYNSDYTVSYKDDQSPLTDADKAANQIIVDSLKEISDHPLISEEEKEVPYESRKDYGTYWLIDPLDGTKEFVKRNGEFTVNIALIKNGVPVLGVVYAPVIEMLYFASEEGGAYKCENVTVDTAQDDILKRSVMLINPKIPVKTKLTIVASKSHLSPETQDFIDSMKQIYKEVELISKGSSLKLCMVAEGKANVYPRFAPTMEWDTGAGHAVCRIAGYQVNEYPAGTPLKYNKENLLNPWFIVM